MIDVDFNTMKIDEMIPWDYDFNARIIFIPIFDLYLLEVKVGWIADYSRYFRLNASDVELYKNDKNVFGSKFAEELKTDSGEFWSERFAGSGALRDYDGVKDFQKAYPAAEGLKNPFAHYGYADGIFYAKLVWKDEIVYVPPYQMKKKGLFRKEYPLRLHCKEVLDAKGKHLCYRAGWDIRSSQKIYFDPQMSYEAAASKYGYVFETLTEEEEEILRNRPEVCNSIGHYNSHCKYLLTDSRTGVQIVEFRNGVDKDEWMDWHEFFLLDKREDIYGKEIKTFQFQSYPEHFVCAETAIIPMAAFYEEFMLKYRVGR